MRRRECWAAVLAASIQFAAALPASAAAEPNPLVAGSGPSWQVLTDPVARVEFHGVPIDGGPRSAGAMAYPTAGLGLLGLAVGVMVHAGLEGAKQSGERTAAQEAADKVTEPYRTLLAEWSQQDLWGEALADGRQGVHPAGMDKVDKGQGLLELRPTLVMTQDQRALLLESQILVRRPGLHQEAPLPLKVTIVSAPQAAEKVQERWLAERGSLLKGQLAVLLRESVKVALTRLEAPAADAAPPRQRTIRYMQGGEERVERAQVLAEGCGRFLLQTLRGDFLSVPQGEVAEGGCAGR